MIKEGVKANHMRAVAADGRKALDASRKRARGPTAPGMRALVQLACNGLNEILKVVETELRDGDARAAIESLIVANRRYAKAFDLPGFSPEGTFDETYALFKRAGCGLGRSRSYARALRDFWDYTQTPGQVEAAGLRMMRRELPHFKALVERIANELHCEPTAEAATKALKEKRGLRPNQILPFLQEVREPAQRVADRHVVAINPGYATEIIETPPYLANSTPSSAAGKLSGTDEDTFATSLERWGGIGRVAREYEFLAALWRIIRFLRVIGDARINSGKQDLVHFIEWAHRTTGLERATVYYQLFPAHQIIGPGYASTYAIIGERIREIQQYALKRGKSLRAFNASASPGGRLQGLHGVQPHVPPELLRRSRERILAPTQTRRPVGRRGRTERRDQRTRRTRVHATPHAARHDEVPGGPGEVRPHHGRGRRHPERSRPPPPRGEPILDRPRGQRHPPVGEGRRASRRHEGDDPGAGRLATPGPRSEVESPDVRPVRREGHVPAVLLLSTGGARRDPSPRHPHRLDGRGRIRAVSARRFSGRASLGHGRQGREEVQPPAHGSLGYSPHRGGHPELRRGTDDREKPVRSRAWLDGRPRQAGRIHRQGGPPPHPGRRPEVEARRDRDRRQADRVQHDEMDRDRSGKAGRPGHVRDPLPEVEGEHRVRDVADRLRRDGHGAVGQSPGRPEDGDGRQEALPRPGQRNPESVGLPVGPRTEDKKSDARTRGGRFNQPPRMRGPWRARGPRPRSSWSGTPGSGNGAWCVAPRSILTPTDTWTCSGRRSRRRKSSSRCACETAPPSI